MHTIRGSLVLLLSLASLALGLLAAGPALADETVATVALPTPVSAHAGRVAWSSFDPASGAYRSTTSVGGVTSIVPVRPRTVPFDVDLGPDVDGDTIATYSRCSREPPRRDPAIGNALAQLPDWAGGRGCDLFKFDFATGRETRIATANSLGGSEFLPSIWEGRVAFARVYERRRGRAGDRPYLYVRALAGAERSQRISTGSRSRLRFCTGRHRRCRLKIEPGPTALDLWGRRLAFGWDSGDETGPTSSAYLETIRRRRATKKLLSRVASGDIQGQEVESPVIVNGKVQWMLARFGDTTDNALVRYRIKTRERSEAKLPPTPGDAYLRPALSAAAFDSTVFYLLSGQVPPGEPCTPQSPCLASPGCSPTGLCQLRTSADLVFSPGR
jgi:hypothetical protein